MPESMYIRRRCTCTSLYFPLSSPRDINFRTTRCVQVCVRVRALAFRGRSHAGVRVCAHISKEAERGPHCEKGDERVQPEKEKETIGKRGGQG